MAVNGKHMAKYMQIVSTIKDCIQNETFKPHDPLPTESELTAEFGVSSITVRKAMEIMAQEGLVYRVKGKGTYVADTSGMDSQEESGKKVYLIFDIDAALDASLTRIVHGIQRYCKKRKYQLLLENYAFCEDYLPEDHERSTDAGLIIYMSTGDDERKLDNLRRLSSANVKYVCIDRYLGHYPVNYVGCNNHDGVYAAVEHLIDLGHQKIGFIHENPEISAEQERLQGYMNAMTDHGLSGFITAPYRISEISNCVDAVKASKHTAIICANDYSAAVMVQTLKESGLEVPKDISIVGFDDAETYRFHQPALTTVRQDFFALGYEAARVLHKLMTEPTIGCTRIYTPTQFIVRESTGKNPEYCH